MEDRKYLPTLAELIDRLSISQLKEVKLIDHKEEYAQEISDIVLLTDGVPTYHNSNKNDDIYEILRLVREMNFNKVQINTIGVGTNFLSDKTSDQYKFLSLLSTESNGFFVGF